MHFCSIYPRTQLVTSGSPIYCTRHKPLWIWKQAVIQVHVEWADGKMFEYSVEDKVQTGVLPSGDRQNSNETNWIIVPPLPVAHTSAPAPIRGKKTPNKNKNQQQQQIAPPPTQNQPVPQQWLFQLYSALSQVILFPTINTEPQSIIASAAEGPFTEERGNWSIFEGLSFLCCMSLRWDMKSCASALSKIPLLLVYLTPRSKFCRSQIIILTRPCSVSPILIWDKELHR